RWAVGVVGSFEGAGARLEVVQLGARPVGRVEGHLVDARDTGRVEYRLAGAAGGVDGEIDVGGHAGFERSARVFDVAGEVVVSVGHDDVAGGAVWFAVGVEVPVAVEGDGV